MDFAPGVRARLRQKLEAQGLGHFRTLEALAVATKVLWSGVLAELCWSDDPEYEAGYVATPAAGYARFPHFKPRGAVGGRAFFLARGTDIAELVRRLEAQAMLITEPKFAILGPILNEPK
jgi:6-carboxyhexanoate--CoA ligase